MFSLIAGVADVVLGTCIWYRCFGHRAAELNCDQIVRSIEVHFLIIRFNNVIGTRKGEGKQREMGEEVGSTGKSVGNICPRHDVDSEVINR